MKRAALFLALLLGIGSVIPTAQGQVFGHWVADTTNRAYLYASTQNDSGHVLGQWCYPADGQCFWLLGIRAGCEQGERYPVLVNSDSGSYSLEIYCNGPLASAPGMYRYVFTEFDRITNPVMSSTRIGFAMPLKGDQFSVIRFDLNGAGAALRAMRAVAATRVQPDGKGTVDERL